MHTHPLLQPAASVSRPRHWGCFPLLCSIPPQGRRVGRGHLLPCVNRQWVFYFSRKKSDLSTFSSFSAPQYQCRACGTSAEHRCQKREQVGSCSPGASCGKVHDTLLAHGVAFLRSAANTVRDHAGEYLRPGDPSSGAGLLKLYGDGWRLNTSLPSHPPLASPSPLGTACCAPQSMADQQNFLTSRSGNCNFLAT